MLGILDQRVLTDSNQTLYTVVAPNTLIPKTLIIANLQKSSAVPTIDIYLVASGDTPSDKNHMIVARPISKPETIFFDTDGIYLQAGFSIVVKASIAGCLSCQLSGVVDNV